MKNKLFKTLIATALSFNLIGCSGRTAGMSDSEKTALEEQQLEMINSPYHEVMAFGNQHIIAILEDGTLASGGANNYGECDVQDWKDIVSVGASEHFTVALDVNGKLHVTGSEFFTKQFDDVPDNIKMITLNNMYVSGLWYVTSDGTVGCTNKDNIKKYDPDPREWTNIVQIAEDGWKHVVGLKDDGTVVYSKMITKDHEAEANYDRNAFEGLDNWTDIKYVSTSRSGTIGIKNDGEIIFSDGYQYKRGDKYLYQEYKKVNAGEEAMGLTTKGDLEYIVDVKLEEQYTPFNEEEIENVNSYVPYRAYIDNDGMAHFASFITKKFREDYQIELENTVTDIRTFPVTELPGKEKSEE